jgi:hypothetical protein
MSWARRLKRVFGVEIECCARCGGELKIIASLEEPQLIAKILSHLERAVPAGATTGTVSVTTPTGVLNSNVAFRIP